MTDENTEASIRAYFAERVPQDWFSASPSVESDSEEILCVGVLPPGTSVDEFRERTRRARMAVASEAERLFGTLGRGGTVEVALMSTPFASRFAKVTDRFGTPWMIVNAS